MSHFHPVDIDDLSMPFFEAMDVALDNSATQAETIIGMCRMGLLKMLSNGDSYFVYEVANEADGNRYMVLWLAVSITGKTDFANNLAYIEQLAGGLGITNICFRTNRPGFSRKMPAGWNITQYWWSKEVCPKVSLAKAELH